MSPQPSEDRELNEWKEIAAYLGVTVRAAQLWEKERGLPVRRFAGPRGRVWASSAEIDVWRARAGGPEATLPVRSVHSPRRRRAVLVTACVVATLTVFWLVRRTPYRPPAAFRIEPQTLVVLDRDGAELWRSKFADEFNPSLYRAGITPPPAQFVDLDGNGRLEVLFHYAPLTRSGALVCFSHDGRELWRFVQNREVRTRVETFSRVYNPSRTRVLEGRDRIVFSAGHDLFYPHSVVLLSEGGKPQAEYWHSGVLPHFEMADLNHDSRPELYFGGTNNGDGQATLVVLDPDRIGGASVESHPDYQLLGFPPARENLRVFFPRSCFNRKLNLRNYVANLQPTSNGIIIGVGETDPPESPAVVVYHFDPQMRLTTVVAADSFQRKHRELEANGTLDHAFSKEEEAEFRKIRIVTPAARP